ncbi:MAG TPA: hypothetical protein VGI41_02205 [Candidatus Udaeobacter sp.]
MNLRIFFAELKRRNVYKVAIAYGVVAWLLIQIATQVFPFFEIPNWIVRLVVLLLVIGFPIALVIRTKRCAGWKKILVIGTDGTSDLSKSLRCSIHCAAIRGSRHLCKRFLRQNESVPPRKSASFSFC